MTAADGGAVGRDLAGPCPGAARHTPAPLRLVTHHVQPLSWGGQNVPANRVQVCDNCHYATHVVLEAFRRAGRALAVREVEQHAHIPAGWPIPRFAHATALAGWRAWDAAGRPDNAHPAAGLRGMFPDHLHTDGEPHVH